MSYLSGGSTSIYRSRSSKSSDGTSSSRSKQRISSSSLKSSSKSGLGKSSTGGLDRKKEAKQPLHKVKSSLSRRDSLDLKKSSSRRKSSDSQLEKHELRDLMSKYGYLDGQGESDDVAGEFGFEEYEQYFNRGGPRSSSYRSSRGSYNDDEEEVKHDGDYARETISKAEVSNKPRGILKTNKSKKRPKRRVTFSKNATLHCMPSHELLAARRARKGPWEPAPEHDELWDGDAQEFRTVPLTLRELDALLLQKEREVAREDEAYYSMNYTYPPASSGYAYDDSSSYNNSVMDELDSYMSDMNFEEPSNGNRKSGGDGQKGCYICQPTQQWTVHEVSAWIRDHIAGGDFFCINFEKNRVDGPVFMCMEERDLRNIGIKRRSDRQAILMAKHELLRGSLSQQSCSCSLSCMQVLDRHSKFLEHTQSFLNTL